MANSKIRSQKLYDIIENQNRPKRLGDGTRRAENDGACLDKMGRK